MHKSLAAKNRGSAAVLFTFSLGMLLIVSAFLFLWAGEPFPTDLDEQFQEWLDQRYSRRFEVHEFPTRDREGLPRDVLEAVRRCVLDLIENGNTVVVVDSAGAERTARVCEAIGYERMVQRRGDAT